MGHKHTTQRKRVQQTGESTTEDQPETERIPPTSPKQGNPPDTEHPRAGLDEQQRTKPFSLHSDRNSPDAGPVHSLLLPTPLPRIKPAPLIIIAWLGGLLAGSFIVVQDEILTLARYCGQSCDYIYPLLGSYSQYDAETMADLIIMAGVTLLAVCLLAVTWTRKPKQVNQVNEVKQSIKPEREQPNRWQDN